MIHLKRRFKFRFSGAAALAGVSWAVLAGLVILVDPEVFADYYYLPIWPATFLALAATLRLILGNWRRGLIFGLAGTVYMIFRYLGIGGWVYGLLLVGLAMALEMYFRKT